MLRQLTRRATDANWRCRKQFGVGMLRNRAAEFLLLSDACLLGIRLEYVFVKAPHGFRILVFVSCQRQTDSRPLRLLSLPFTRRTF
jgi:hypothetical protein